MDRIVVGIDGSEGSRTALRWAVDEAARRGGVVQAVYAWQLPVPISGDAITRVDAEANARELLEDVLREEGVLGSANVDPVVSGARPSVALIEASKGATMLVVGSRGHGAFAGMLLGSVSQHCVANATCPVVVVPADADVASAVA